MSYLQIDNLDFRYPGSKTWQLEDFSMSAYKEECTALLGPSGCAKTTVLRLIAGLERPVRGTIALNEEIITNGNHIRPPENRNIGMVFQDYALFPHLNVLNNVMYGLRNVDKQQRKETAEEFIELVGMSDPSKKYPYQLSGGQQQRIALARALAPHPKLLLLDEPFSNLDATLRSRIRRDVHEILVRANITSILVTHDQADSTALADRVIRLSA